MLFILYNIMQYNSVAYMHSLKTRASIQIWVSSKEKKMKPKELKMKTILTVLE